MSLIDISQRVTAKVAVFPGDTPFSIRKVMSMASGDSCDVGTVNSTLHAGTHADAPSHFVPEAPGIGEMPIEKYFGPVRVVERIGDGPVTADDLRGWRLQHGMRYLLRSRETVDPDVYPDAYAHLTPEAAAALTEIGAMLFGIDTPSVDHRDSKELAAHKELLRGNVAILENLDLSAAPPGLYELMAFPLKLAGADASPVRAVLRTLM